MARFLQKASSVRFRGYMFPPLQEFRWGFSETTTQLCNFSTEGKKKSKSDASDSGEENLSKKESALNLAMDQITKSFGKGSIMWLGRSVSQRKTPVVSTGSFALDVALGIGGLPKGRIVEIYGPEASGKTTIALHVIAEAQKLGGCCAYVDAEHTLVPSLAEAIGVNTENLLIAQPDCGEKALSLVDTLIRSGSVDVVVVDSVAALVPKGELHGEMGDAVQARLMSQALRKLTLSLSLSQTVLLFTNQVESKLFTFRGFGGPSEVRNALKFYASIRLNIKRTALIKKGEETTGSQVTVKVMKNKYAPPYKTAVFELEFGKGICRESELLDLGCKYNFISKAGCYFKMNDRSCQGKVAFKRYLAENVSDRQQLEKNLRDRLFNDEESTTQVTDR